MLLETNRLVLTPTSSTDAAFMLKLMNTPKWLENIGDRNIHSIEESQDYLDKSILPLIRKMGYGSFIIRLNDTPIGTCGLYQRKGIQELDLGFALLPQYEGKGYAKEAASCLIEQSKKWGLQTLKAYANPDNTRSIQLLKKLNFVQTGYIHLGTDNEEVLAFQLVL